MSTNYSNINNPSGSTTLKFQKPAGESNPTQSEQDKKLLALIFPRDRDLLRDQLGAVALETMMILKKELSLRPKKDWSTATKNVSGAYKKINNIVNQVFKNQIAMELQRQKIKAIMLNMSKKFQEFLKPKV